MALLGLAIALYGCGSCAATPPTQLFPMSKRPYRIPGYSVCLFATLVGCGSDPSEQSSSPPPVVDKPPEAVPLLLVDRAPSLLPSAGPVEGAWAAFADLDGDGRPDIAQPTSQGLLLYWNGESKFEKASASALPSEFTAPKKPAEDEEPIVFQQVLAGDFDADGLSDLLIVSTGKTPLRLLTHKDARSFQSQTIAVPEGSILGHAAVADIDGDGDTDVIVTLGGEASGSTGAPNALLLINDGKGKFADQSLARLVAPGLSSRGVAVGDVDGDGAPDLVFSGDTTGHRLLLNDGKGYFRDAPPDALPAGQAPGGKIPAMGDLNGDGALDILIPSSQANQVLINDGKGNFTDETAFVLGSQPGKANVAVLVDLDRDTLLDVVLAGPSVPLRILRNDGTGRLFDYSANMVPQGPAASEVVSLGVADVDGDKDPDLFVSRQGLASPWLLVNWHPEPMDDTDGDGIPDEIDNCPKEPNPDQANSDAYAFNCSTARQCKTATGCVLKVFGESSYLLCDEPKTWQAARAFCRSRGADLVVIDSKEENELLAASGIPTAWIGLSDQQTEGSFLWVNGKSLTTAYWNDDEPNDSGGAEDCVGMFTSGETAGLWNDFSCDAEHAFICEEKTFRGPQDPGDACDVCPNVYDPNQKDSDADGVGDACTTESPE
ncbi:MAG TPA: FG-GAP-like repeat-containing protein [Polyangiaceae bacterium]|nr:FG-GAP-like repeat-containing protein [Polyangiaceae bacterium]HNZ23278.1 FG-GAP-like repeat-containing protein [Polyangiaceae bacterium]HOD21952.1 FG-GAP-like repeat-containing protein [Polyangiaceae bacterium]HOE51499.1 FG-GAP-like repeat-containing protein [Polyangiaceae bacterium]HOH00984.1 FG-GAP-like repeat-containing protein [Polyangiaceae bacterium]